MADETTVTKNLWSEYNGKGFLAKHADYAVRASQDVNGKQIDTTYATKEELSGKQDALPSSSATQYLTTDGNNVIAWQDIPDQRPSVSFDSSTGELHMDFSGT